jgi:hypothetical protein
MYPTDSKSLPAHEQSSRLVVVTLGLSHPIEEDRLAPFRAVHAKNAEDALRILTEGGVAALLLGPCADLLQVPDLLARSAAKPSGNPAPATIVLCAASEPDALQKLVDAGQIFTWPAEKLVRSSSHMKSCVLRSQPGLSNARKGVDALDFRGDSGLFTMHFLSLTDRVSVARL